MPGGTGGSSPSTITRTTSTATQAQMPIVLAFDTATEVATCALVSDGHVLGERTTTAAALLHDIEAIVAGAGVAPEAIECITVGRGPGRYTSLRMGLVTARALS